MTRTSSTSFSFNSHYHPNGNTSSSDSTDSNNNNNNSSSSINLHTSSISHIFLPSIMNEDAITSSGFPLGVHNKAERFSKAQFLQFVATNNYEQVKCALREQPDLIFAKTSDHFHYTALHRASQLGYTNIVKLLLSYGANIHELSDRVSWRACLLAAKHGHTEVVRCLLEAGEDVNVQLAYKKNRFTCLHFAAQYSHTELARMLLKEYNARIDIVSANGLRPIHTAANFGNFEIVELILDYGKEDVNVRHASPWRYTPLHWAVQENKYKTVEVLIKRRADVNAVTGNTNLTPLIECATKDYPEIAKLLLDNGADHKLRNKSGLRAIHVAANNNSVRTLCVILDYAKTEIHAIEKNIHGREFDPLRFAIIGQAKDCVRELLNRGANTRGIIDWMNGLMNKETQMNKEGSNFKEILEMVKIHEEKLINKRGNAMLNCTRKNSFVDLCIVTRSV
jgi:ankyrin repeat protein